MGLITLRGGEWGGGVANNGIVVQDISFPQMDSFKNVLEQDASLVRY